ncbi:hypothetical protein [Nocardioides currus]|uniref:Uncharacterized protein n=1 Tax=Nocardioides currus TaxID=2133958 RepID=A0A2R7YRP2_9ACTN|nr:hypothetical protein [Nocardioides currus]PUA78963.1 hypothetical protein C7S10_20995 [Nocardioides currus]
MSRPIALLLASAVTLVSLVAAPAAAARDTEVIGGNTTGLDGVLRKGCQDYRFAYAVQVPTEDWSMEVSIVDRRGQAVASFAFLGPVDPKTRTAVFTLCRNATVPGKFRIRSVLNWYDDPSEPIPAYVPVTRFRLARR